MIDGGADVANRFNKKLQSLCQMVLAIEEREKKKKQFSGCMILLIAHSEQDEM